MSKRANDPVGRSAESGSAEADRPNRAERIASPVGLRAAFAALSAGCALISLSFFPGGADAAERLTNSSYPRRHVQTLDLSKLPAPDARFACHLPLFQWRDLSLDLRGDSRVGGEVRQALTRHLDPRAGTFLDPSLLDRTTEFALSIWPDLRIAGDRRPVWLMGYRLDSSETAEGLRESIGRRLRRESGVPVVRTFLGVRIESVDASAKDLHLAAVGPFLLVSSNLRALQDYLRTQADSPPAPAQTKSPVSFFWRLDPPERRGAPRQPGVVRALTGLGVRALKFQCERLSPGFRLRMAVEGALPKPDAPPEIEFDPSLIDHLPEGADFILWGGSAVEEPIFLSPEFPGLPALPRRGVVRPFGFGVGIPEATGVLSAPARISGAYRRPPSPIPQELLPAEVRPATGESHETEEDDPTFRLGDLELALLERQDRVVFRNVASRPPTTALRDRLESIAAPRENLARPIFVGMASPRLLRRPLDLEFEARRAQSEASLYDLWPLFRQGVHPVDLAVFISEGGGVEVELTSPSILSPMLVLAHLFNSIHLLALGEPDPLERWLGEFAPLPAE